MTGDHRLELVVGAGIGGGPRVAVWDNLGLMDEKSHHKVCNDFFAIGPDPWDPDEGARTGITVTVVDINRDGYGDVLTTFLNWSNNGLATDGWAIHIGRIVSNHLDVYTPGAPGPTGTLYSASRYAVKDFDGDAYPDLAVGKSGAGRVFLFEDHSTYPFTKTYDTDPFNGMLDGPNTGGVWVA